MSIKTMELAGVIADVRCQSRVELDDILVGEYAEAIAYGDVFPPVSAVQSLEGAYLYDGFHRFYAMKRAGKTSARVDVREGTFRDAVLLAAAANANHGKRRTNADKRKSVETLLSDPEWSQWSDREIARRCAVSPDTVNRLRHSLSDSDSEITPEVRSKGRTYTNRHGNVTTMNTANIGKRVAHEETLRFGDEMRKSVEPAEEDIETTSHTAYEVAATTLAAEPVDIRAAQREQARREQAQAAQLMEAVGDPKGTIAQARLKATYSKGVVDARRDLIALDSAVVADVLDANDRASAQWFVRDMREWLDGFDENLRRGIRLVTAKGA